LDNNTLKHQIQFQNNLRGASTFNHQFDSPAWLVGFDSNPYDQWFATVGSQSTDMNHSRTISGIVTMSKHIKKYTTI